MPIPWIGLPVPLSMAVPLDSSPSGPQHESQVDEDLHVRWKFVTYTRSPQSITYSSGVTATYGAEVVSADRMTLFPGEHRGEATGNVKLVDPDGVITADHITFNWGDHTGVADNAELVGLGVHATAKQIVILPTLWTLTDVYGTNWRGTRPLYSLRIPKLTLIPGEHGTLHHPRVTLLGQTVTLPNVPFSLNNRASGFRFPSLSYRRGAGLGIDWRNQFALDDQTVLSNSYFAFKGDYPRLTFQLSRSLIPSYEATELLAPRSELRERFDYGYFDDVKVGSPEREAHYIHARRSTLSAGTFWNVTGAGRTDNELFTKPLELTYEASGDYDGLGLLGQARIHSIRQVHGRSTTRALLEGAALLPAHFLAKGLSTSVRFNAAGYLGGTTFGWLRSETGLVYQPIKPFRVGAAYVLGGQAGTPFFDADELVSQRGYLLRADLVGGATKISLLEKYDSKRRKWFDREYSISQAVGGLEFYVLWRQFPSDSRIGVRIRLDELYNALQRRRISQSGGSH